MLMTYEEIMKLNKERSSTFVSIQKDPVNGYDTLIFKEGESVVNSSFMTLFANNAPYGYETFSTLESNIPYITNLSDLKPYIKYKFREACKLELERAYREYGIKQKLSTYTSRFDSYWQNLTFDNNKKSVTIISFDKTTKSFITDVPCKWDNNFKICDYTRLYLKDLLMKSDPLNGKYIKNLSEVRNIIEACYRAADKKAESILSMSEKLRASNEKNTAIFDSIKDIFEKCAKEYNISAPFNDTGASYSIKHTSVTQDETFTYQTTNTVIITMYPKVIKIKYSFWKDSDNFENETVIEKTVPFKKIDSKDKMRKLIEQIIKSLKRGK